MTCGKPLGSAQTVHLGRGQPCIWVLFVDSGNERRKLNTWGKGMKVCIWRANAEICLRETCGLQQTGLSMKLDQNRMSQFALITRFPDLFLLLFSRHIHPTLIFPVSQVPNSCLCLLCLFSSLQSDIIFSNFSILLKPMNRFVIQTHTGLYDIIHIIDYVSGFLIENGVIGMNKSWSEKVLHQSKRKENHK